MADEPRRSTSRTRLAAGIAAGVATHVLFLYTVWRLFWFLRDGGGPAAPGWWWWDSLLACQFCLVHSLLLWPPARRRLTAWIAAPFYGCFFCAATCLGLLLLFACWRTSSAILWDWAGPLHTCARVGFYASWAALMYSLSLTGLGYQTGLTPWWRWVRGQPQLRREFEVRGAYRWLRHPVYLSFLGLIWFTPRMSLDHAVLTGWWTIHIFVGSYLKDERLAFYLGDVYRQYQQRTPGYPWVGLGPLGRRASPAEGPGQRPATRQESHGHDKAA